jgi:crossover junction endodeoxyribonuclease RuvC
MKIILGIDPGLASTGYGIIGFDGTRYRHIGHGVIHTAADEDMGARLLKIHARLDEVITAYRPQEAGVETLYFAKNSKSALPVSQARGVILFTLASHDIPFAEYTPHVLKQAVIGRGRGEKRQVQELLKLVLQLPEIPKPDHAADALAVAVCHANHSGAAAMPGSPAC